MDPMVEQEQEKQGDVGRRVSAAGPLVAWSCWSVLLLSACDGGSAVRIAEVGPADSIHSERRLAWTGGRVGGPYLLVEELSQPAHASATIGGEEDLFRSTFSLADDLRLLRVQLLGASVDPRLGEVVAGDTVFQPLGDPPQEADARARLYWYAVTRGVQEFLPEASSITRISYLVAAEHAPSLQVDGALEWRLGELRIDLTPRNWTEPQRRAYLDAPADSPDE